MGHMFLLCGGLVRCEGETMSGDKMLRIVQREEGK